MYEKETKNKTQTNKQYKRILEQQVRLSEGSLLLLIVTDFNNSKFTTDPMFLDGIAIERC